MFLNKNRKGSLFMNYSTLFLISMASIAVTFCTNSLRPAALSPNVQIQQTKSTIETETEIELWLLNYFAKKSFTEDIVYTPELFNRIKQHLLANGYIQHVPHKELKKTVKNKIIDLRSKKHQTDKWISKNKKSIKATVSSYLQSHPQAKPQNIIKYLNNPSSKNKTCKQLQLALKDPELLPELIKQIIKKIIETVQK